jgi:hypothetical protein
MLPDAASRAASRVAHPQLPSSRYSRGRVSSSPPTPTTHHPHSPSPISLASGRGRLFVGRPENPSKWEHGRGSGGEGTRGRGRGRETVPRRARASRGRLFAQKSHFARIRFARTLVVARRCLSVYLPLLFLFVSNFPCHPPNVDLHSPLPRAVSSSVLPSLLLHPNWDVSAWIVAGTRVPGR